MKTKEKNKKQKQKQKKYWPKELTDVTKTSSNPTMDSNWIYLHIELAPSNVVVKGTIILVVTVKIRTGYCNPQSDVNDNIRWFDERLRN